MITIGAVEGNQPQVPSNPQGLSKQIAAEYSVTRVPLEFKMLQSYPNPFRQTASIRFQIPGSDKVKTSIEIMSIDGKVIRTLVNDDRVSGYYTVTWDGKGNNQNTMPSGTYLYRISAGSFNDIKRMVLLR